MITIVNTWTKIAENMFLFYASDHICVWSVLHFCWLSDFLSLPQCCQPYDSWLISRLLYIELIEYSDSTEYKLPSKLTNFLLILFAEGEGKETRLSKFEINSIIAVLHPWAAVLAYCPENNSSERCKMTCSPLFFLVIVLCQEGGKEGLVWNQRPTLLFAEIKYMQWGEAGLE